VRVNARKRVLEVDGTFASVWRSGSPATGSVWDALAAPLLALPPARRRAVLVLGLGGGSVARLVRAVAPRARIVGVERDREVLRAARRWFDLDALGLELRCDDARDYLVGERRRFDLIVEDVFVGRGRAARKPGWLPEPGLRLAVGRLTPGGVLVANSLDEAAAVLGRLTALLPHCIELRIEGFDNRIVAASDRALDARRLRRALARDPVLAATLPRLRLRTAAQRAC
jgi:spermidine synthase